jgi:iron only hydrogenase large subunit-like protein
MNKVFYHALKFREDHCIGCSHCMNVCPTEAVRVWHGKAQLHANRCIDCGECYRVCPVGAIIVEQDDFDNIYHYTTRIALLPSVFTGQFPASIQPSEIRQALSDLGFTHVVEVEEGVEFLSGQILKYVAEHSDSKPLISSFCPAIVRLIQVKFPTLVDHIIRLKAPVDVTALHTINRMKEEGLPPEETGLFYVNPCAAKIAAVREPVGEQQSLITGVINMNYLYNRVWKIISKQKRKGDPPGPGTLTTKSLCWSLTHGESDQVKMGKSLAIDEINNVIEFLEKLENDEIKGIDFIELRACDESCAGGILCPGNRFLTVSKMRESVLRQESVLPSERVNDQAYTPEQYTFLEKNVHLGAIHPRSIMKLDDNVAEAMVKMKRIYELRRVLPQVDCGICGAPTCSALSEDVVQGQADIRQCIFVQKIMEQNEKLDISESVRIMQEIWSDSKLDKNSLKEGINFNN